MEDSSTLPEEHDPAELAGVVQRSVLRRLLTRPEAGAVMAAVAVFLFFSIFSPHFFSLRVLQNVMLLSAEIGIVAVGVTMLMVAGEFDLSVGSVLGLGGGLVVVWANAGWPVPVAILLALLVGAAIGAANGLLVTRLGLHSLIVTLGGLMFYRAVVLTLNQGSPIRLGADTSGAGGVEVGSDPYPLLQIFDFIWVIEFWEGAVLRVPAAFLWFLAFIVIFTIILTLTKFGNWIYAAGGGPEAARQMGVPVNRVKIMAFACASLCAVASGIVQMSRANEVDSTTGIGIELEAVLAVVVGGALVTGGQGSIIGSALGVMMVSMIKQGLVLMGTPAYWYKAGIGVILIVAAFINYRVQQSVRGSKI